MTTESMPLPFRVVVRRRALLFDPDRAAASRGSPIGVAATAGLRNIGAVVMPCYACSGIGVQQRPQQAILGFDHLGRSLNLRLGLAQLDDGFRQAGGIERLCRAVPGDILRRLIGVITAMSKETMGSTS